MNSQYPASQRFFLTGLLREIHHRRRSTKDEIRLWISILYQSKVLYQCSWDSTLRDLRPVFKERLYLDEKLKLEERVSQIYFSIADDNLAPKNYDVLSYLERLVVFRSAYHGVIRPTNAPGCWATLTSEHEETCMRRLIHLYQHLEDIDSSYFWVAMLERNPLRTEVIELLRTLYGHVFLFRVTCRCHVAILL